MTAVELEAAAEAAASILKESAYCVAFTGAGISVPSGIPDFRSTHTGLWSKDNPMEVASLTAFRYKPEKFFNWLRPLAQHMWEAQPNPAHTGLALLESKGYVKAVVTQNIDGLHQRAGSHEVIEVHGTVDSVHCYTCDQDFPSADFKETFILQESIPRCPNCKAILKPNIVLFEEMLPVGAWQQAQNHFEKADLVLVVGSSLEVTPAANLPLIALENNAQIIILTYSPTYLDSHAELLLPFDVAEILPRIAARL